MTPEEKFQEIPTNIPDLGKGCRTMDDDDGLTEAELVNLRKSMNRHKGALQRLAGSHVCTLRYCGIRTNNGKEYDVYICSDPDCQREEWRPYSGAIDTVEGRM